MPGLRRLLLRTLSTLPWSHVWGRARSSPCLPSARLDPSPGLLLLSSVCVVYGCL